MSSRQQTTRLKKRKDNHRLCIRDEKTLLRCEWKDIYRDKNNDFYTVIVECLWKHKLTLQNDVDLKLLIFTLKLETLLRREAIVIM